MMVIEWQQDDVASGNFSFSEQNMPLSARLFEVQEPYSTL